MIGAADLQIAVDAVLYGNISAPVWDEVPPETPAPYVKLGAMSSIPEDAHDQMGADSTFTVHVWDDQTSSLRVKRIGDEIEALLHHRWLSWAGGRAYVALSARETIEEQEPDGKTWRHEVLRFRARSHEV